MATASTEKKIASSKKSFLGIDGVTLPYVIAIAAQLPLLLYYFSTLWSRPHYQFFPFALITIVVFAINRWPRSFSEPFFARKLGAILFWAGVMMGIVGALFATAWFSALSVFLLLTSLFSITKDGEVSGKSLLVLALPLLIILMPPNNLDFRLITILQQVSAQISSWYLDVLNFKHFSPGTTLNFPNQQYEVEQACSGVQSFFTLMFCTSFLIIALRRPWFRGLMLLISAGFWAVLMNSVRILVIPIAENLFGVSLIDGISHDILGYVVMMIAIVLILSTDQLMEFAFGKSQNLNDEVRPSMFGRLFGNQTQDTSTAQDEAAIKKPVSKTFQRVAVVASVLMIAFGVLQFVDFVRSMNQPRTKIRFFSKDVIVDVDRAAMPEEIESVYNGNEYRWVQAHYDRSDRTIGSDLGQRSDSWVYRSRTGLRVVTSLDQTFPGWHELTTCYKNQGYVLKRGERRKKVATFVNEEGETVEWPYIEADLLEPTTGQRGLLLFSFTDSAGRPFQAPVDWSNLRSFFERAKNRLSYNVRSSLFRGEAHQMQVFVRYPRNFSEAQRDEIVQQYLQVRKAMRSSIIKYGNDDDLVNSDSPGDSGDKKENAEPAKTGEPVDN